MKARWVRLLILVSTVALAWGSLTVGVATEQISFQPGDRADREYIARKTEQVPDTELTERLRQEAEDGVEGATRRDSDNEQQVFDEVEAFLAAVRAGVPGPELPQPGTVLDPTTTTSAPETTTTTGDTDGTTTTEPPALTTLEMFVFLDVNGDAAFDEEIIDPETQWRADFGLGGVRVVVTPSEGTQVSGEARSDGAVSLEVPQGELIVTIDHRDPDYPAGFAISEGAIEQTVECRGETCTAAPVGFAPNTRPIEVQTSDLAAEFPLMPETSLETLAKLATQDIVRELAGQNLALDTIAFETSKELTELFANGVTSQNINELKSSQQSDPPFFNIDGERNDDAREAVADIITAFLVPNRVPDPVVTEERKAEARASIPEQTVTFFAGDVIAAPPDRLTQLQIDAIRLTGAISGESVPALALAVVITVLVVILAFYLARFRPQFWDRPRMVALWGLLTVLGAGAVRLAVELEDRTSWYILPAVALGYLAAVLFDNRMGTLMALMMGVLAAAGTREAGVATFAALATLSPIGFVSKASSRRAFRNSVITSSLAVAVIAAAMAWYYENHLDEQIWGEVGLAAGWAFAASLIASMVVVAAMPFFEAMFDITTTLRLLELTDRNHEALLELQEKAFGTFNHSLMVGTLADSAARAVGANNLLARAAAYYHDIGKTENPLFFIENQFGIPNPHDELSPEESAEIVRQHVLDGVRLAKEHKIPSEVAEGIVTHHGDGIMRYFYEKARQSEGDRVDPNLFRHAGHKPQSKEMAIVMMADAVEGACRALFAEEEPSADAIVKVVNRVIDEKVADGQLNASDLTLGELTRVRQAFIEALVGHYHQRIPYPNFPGS